MSRADLIYETLTSLEHNGEWVSRRTLFADAGEFYLTNNASSEARVKYGVEIKHKLINGEHCYRVLGEGREPHQAPPDVPPFPEHPPAVDAHAAPAAEPLIPPLPGQLTLQ